MHMADAWDEEERYWRDKWSTRPYARGTDYDTLSPGYRYGYESATRYRGRAWCQRTLKCGHDRTSENRPLQVGVFRHP